MIGASIPSTAASRKRRRRMPTVVMRSRDSRGQTSWEIVPAIETSNPEEVERKAAKAPAAVIAPRTLPTAPGQAAWGRRSTTVSVAPVT